MKIVIKIALGLFGLFAVVSLAFLFATRDTRPATICSSLDHGTRSRDYCLMNPFRDREPELVAEKVLTQLKDGNVQVLLPLLSDESKPRIVENEAKYRIKTWHIGGRRGSGDHVEIMYWVERVNYNNVVTARDYVEEVTFTIVHDASGWVVNQYSAIY